jgi:homospermidine synthase
VHQITSVVLPGMVWAIENPRRSIFESQELDHERILSILEPYLDPLVGQYTDLTPLSGRGDLFPEDVDRQDPWLFRNVVVS